MDDPLGLTEHQRRVSDASERYGALIGPMLADLPEGAGIISALDRACGYCRRYGHTETDCPMIIPGDWSEQ
jgi:hypothetical protein